MTRGDVGEAGPRLCVRPAHHHVLAQRALNRRGSCDDEADAAAVVGRVDLAQVDAVDLDACPASAGTGPASSRRMVDLPLPMRPRMAMRSPGRMRSVTPLSTRRARRRPSAGRRSSGRAGRRAPVPVAGDVAAARSRARSAGHHPVQRDHRGTRALVARGQARPRC